LSQRGGGQPAAMTSALPGDRPTRRPDVLVLGGGGVLGEAWLRALLAGLEAGTGWDMRECDAFVGTSAGSIVSAVLAAGRRPEAARGAAEGWERAAGASAAPARRARRPSALKGAGSVASALATPIAPLASAGLAPAGAALRAAVLARGRRGTRDIPGLREQLARLDLRFDGRLRVTAVELATGRRVVFGAPGAPAAEATEAVLASCAVPWVFKPVTIGGRQYVDGGAWSAANLDAAPARRGTEVLCLNPTATPRLGGDRLGAVRAFSGGSAAAEALVLRARGARVRIVAPDEAAVEAIGPDLFDPARRAAVEAAGYRQGRDLAG
jgi:NTE family protein